MNAYRALHDALADRQPLCAGDDRFIADAPSTEDIAEMAGMCELCSVRARCLDYALAAKPAAGFWAGIRPPRTYAPRAARSAEDRRIA
ncbi:WhiB family transcriptional regulator [Agromyces subbeticus]|uniref:WhiB family transcriptional regulator n=1 Tax=Agromyces subbeticus TaxID=293890 RepID=UPI0012EB5D45|nr:WhiB family transcriptional regulator [Agromyces subbeticus]